jgi:hypothetical protein
VGRRGKRRGELLIKEIMPSVGLKNVEINRRGEEKREGR